MALELGSLEIQEIGQDSEDYVTTARYRGEAASCEPVFAETPDHLPGELLRYQLSLAKADVLEVPARLTDAGRLNGKPRSLLLAHLSDDRQSWRRPWSDNYRTTGALPRWTRCNSRRQPNQRLFSTREAEFALILSQSVIFDRNREPDPRGGWRHG
jgi:hypothetical protein